MNNKASITALMSAFGRAYHTEKVKNPIFKDVFAKSLMSDQEYQMIASYILGGIDFFAPDKKEMFATDDDTLNYLVHTQIAPTPIVRARFCEDSLKTAMMTGTEQYVILGAGMDTFAFRENDFMKKYSVFEVMNTVFCFIVRISVTIFPISDIWVSNLTYILFHGI